MHVIGRLSCMWQGSCRACDRTSVVVRVAGHQLSCMWQDNSYRSCDRTTVVLVTAQQLWLWQHNSCVCDSKTVVVICFTLFYYIFERNLWVWLYKRLGDNSFPVFTQDPWNTFPLRWTVLHFARCIIHQTGWEVTNPHVVMFFVVCKIFFICSCAEGFNP
jgi:hypothetical protein